LNVFGSYFSSSELVSELEKEFQRLVIGKIKRKKDTISTIIDNWDVL